MSKEETGIPGKDKDCGICIECSAVTFNGAMCVECEKESKKPDGYIVVDRNGFLVREYREFPTFSSVIFYTRDDAANFIMDEDEESWKIRPVRLVFLDGDENE